MSIINKTQIDTRVILSGTVTTFAIMNLLMMISGGMGLWSFDVDHPTLLTQSFWLWAFTFWILSCFSGAFIAAVTARGNRPTLHAFLNWASVNVIGTFLLPFLTASFFPDTGTTASMQFIFWGAFVANFVAILASLMGARMATSYPISFSTKLDSEEPYLSTKSGGRIRPAVLGILLVTAGLLFENNWWQLGVLILVVVFVEAAMRYSTRPN
jgi:hypothetical protein